MVNSLQDKTFGEDVAPSEWNALKNGVQDIYPSGAGGIIVGSATGPVERTAPINVDYPPYNAVGDGTTNDSAAIQAAIDAASAAGGGVVELSGRAYKVALQLKVGVWLRGRGSTTSGTLMTRLIGITGQDVLTFPSAGSNVGFGVEDLVISGGRHGIYLSGGATYTTYVRLRNLHIVGGTGDCIHLEPVLIEEWYVDQVSLYGGQDGFFLDGGRMDKCVFNTVETRLQTRYGWNIACDTDLGAGASSSACTWINPIIHTPAQHGFVGKGGTVRAWTFVTPYSEGIGTSGKSNRTTGSITTGTATLTVASGTGLVNGDPIVVQGAGANGIDLFTTISSGGGTTTLTLAANASTTVTSAKVTNASYDDFNFPAGVGDIAFMGGRIGDEGSGGHVRYTVNAVGASVKVSGNGTVQVNDLPVYDPSRVASGFDSIRQPDNFTNHNMIHAMMAGPRNAVEMIRTLIPSPPGRDVVVALRDSTDNTSGTFGFFRVRKNDASKVVLLEVRGDINRVSTRGAFIANGQVGVISFTNADTTPSVQAGNTFQTANAGATTITTFDDGIAGHVIKVRAGDANTTVANNATIKTNTGANKLLALDKVYTFTLFGTVWCENA